MYVLHVCEKMMKRRKKFLKLKKVIKASHLFIRLGTFKPRYVVSYSGMKVCTQSPEAGFNKTSLHIGVNLAPKGKV
jgi:hypothetical protein